MGFSERGRSQRAASWKNNGKRLRKHSRMEVLTKGSRSPERSTGFSTTFYTAGGKGGANVVHLPREAGSGDRG